MTIHAQDILLFSIRKLSLAKESKESCVHTRKYCSTPTRVLTTVATAVVMTKM
jgi:hypothetical protein